MALLGLLDRINILGNHRDIPFLKEVKDIINFKNLYYINIPSNSRHAIKDKCVNGLQACREWRTRRARRNLQNQGDQWPLNAQANVDQDQPIYNGNGYSCLNENYHHA